MGKMYKYANQELFVQCIQQRRTVGKRSRYRQGGKRGDWKVDPKLNIMTDNAMGMIYNRICFMNRIMITQADQISRNQADLQNYYGKSCSVSEGSKMGSASQYTVWTSCIHKTKQIWGIKNSIAASMETLVEMASSIPTVLLYHITLRW